MNDKYKFNTVSYESLAEEQKMVLRNFGRKTLANINDQKGTQVYCIGENGSMSLILNYILTDIDGFEEIDCPSLVHKESTKFTEMLLELDPRALHFIAKPRIIVNV